MVKESAPAASSGAALLQPHREMEEDGAVPGGTGGSGVKIRWRSCPLRMMTGVPEAFRLAEGSQDDRVLDNFSGPVRAKEASTDKAMRGMWPSDLDGPWCDERRPTEKRLAMAKLRNQDREQGVT